MKCLARFVCCHAVSSHLAKKFLATLKNRNIVALTELFFLLIRLCTVTSVKIYAFLLLITNAVTQMKQIQNEHKMSETTWRQNLT